MSYDYADSEVDASVIYDLRKRVSELEIALSRQAAAPQGREVLQDLLKFAEHQSDFASSLYPDLPSIVKRAKAALTPAVAPDGAGKIANAVARLRQYASVLDSDAFADADNPNLREDIEAVCTAALGQAQQPGEDKANPNLEYEPGEVAVLPPPQVDSGRDEKL